MAVWKCIEGYEGLYQISSLGEIMSMPRIISVLTPVPREWNTEGRIVKQQKSPKGYKNVSLSKAGKQRTYRVHRLVAEAFLPKKDMCDEVNHIDCNKDNNAVTNLEWSNRSENMSHASINGRMHGAGFKGETHPHHKLSETDVLSIRRGYASGVRIVVLAKEYGVSVGAIACVVKRRTWVHLL